MPRLRLYSISMDHCPSLSCSICKDVSGASYAAKLYAAGFTKQTAPGFGAHSFLEPLQRCLVLMKPCPEQLRSGGPAGDCLVTGRDRRQD